MDNEEAKLILSAYRPGGEDASDPFFAEALEQARRDPELGKWLAEQCRQDKLLQDALQTLKAPSGLRESLLLNCRVSQMKKPAPARRWTGRTIVAVAVVACVLLGAGIFVMPPPQEPRQMSGSQLASAVHQLQNAGRISLGKVTSDTAQLREWLAERGAPHDFPLPSSLQNLESMGCQSFLIHGVKVSLICFIMDQNRLVHLFVIDDSAMTDPLGATPSIKRDGRSVAAMWSSGGRTFLLTGENLDEETLRRLI